MFLHIDKLELVLYLGFIFVLSSVKNMTANVSITIDTKFPGGKASTFSIFKIICVCGRW